MTDPSLPQPPCWKESYTSRGEAQRVLRNMRDPKRRRLLDAYLCNACDRWHLGGGIRRRRDTRQMKRYG